MGVRVRYRRVREEIDGYVEKELDWDVKVILYKHVLLSVMCEKYVK